MDMIGRPVGELPTPALLIDMDVVRRNMERAADLARKAGKKLRPHVKTHKLPELARMQIELGAVGVCAAKVSEAEVMADGGVRDILLANEIVGEDKLARLTALAERVTVTVLADSLETEDMLERAAARAGVTLRVMVELDSGDERCGAAPEAVPVLAERIAASPVLQFAGLETYGGAVFHCSDREESRRRAAALGALLERVKASVEERGVPVEEVSVGGSPSMALLAELDVITELRPGVYVYNDGACVCRGSAEFEDCAASVLTTVISIPDKRRMVVDGGGKTFSYCCPGVVYGRKLLHGVLRDRSDMCLASLSEEHGVFLAGEDEEDFSAYHVGDKVQVIPAHICPVINLFDSAWLCSNGVVERAVPIAARGMTQ